MTQLLRGNASHIYLPEGNSAIAAVRDRLGGESGGGGMPTAFEPYYHAVKECWPELYKANTRAVVELAVEVFLEMAEIEGFEVVPEGLVSKRRRVA